MAATDLSLRHDLPMADALIYAVALTRSATLVTADTYFPDIEGGYIAREEGIPSSAANSRGGHVVMR